MEQSTTSNLKQNLKLKNPKLKHKLRAKKEISKLQWNVKRCRDI